MRQIRLLTLLILAACTSACGQTITIDYSVDSIRFVNAEWSVDSLDGFVLKRYHFGEGALFCSAQHLCLIEIPKDSPRKLAFAYSDSLSEVSRFALEQNAYAAINGTYFDMDLGNPICYLRIGGQNLGENTPQKKDSINRKYYQHATILLKDGKAHLIVPDSNRLYEERIKDDNVMTAGPMLLRKGRYVPQRDDRTFVTKRHNRTSLGIKKDGTTLLLVVDGRFKDEAEGMSLNELEHVMHWLGCTDAINLDGGGSTTMYVKGEPDDGIVNYPSDNNMRDHLGQRPVSNAILLL